MKKVMISVIGFLFVIVLSSFLIQPKPWDVPAEYKAMKNPLKKTEKVLSEGKMHYDQVCAGCHGLTGKGDGEKVKNLVNVVPANLDLAEFKHESDGEHFYKIKFGRNNIHSFRGKLDDDAIWSVVNYLKTFK